MNYIINFILICLCVMACGPKHKSSDNGKSVSLENTRAAKNDGEPNAAATSAPDMPDTTSEAESVGPQVPLHTLYVIIDGNNTCKPEVVEPLFPDLRSNVLYLNVTNILQQQDPTASPADILFVCYNNRSPQMHFLFSNSGLPMQPILEGDLDGLVLSHLSNVQKINIIGFSYGGGRGMHLAASLAKTTPLPLSLITIDPVSRLNCQRLLDPGCTGACVPLTPEDRTALDTRVYWMHFFHNPPAVIRSGYYPEADDNIQVRSTHLGMKDDPSIWATIGTYIVSQ